MSIVITIISLIIALATTIWALFQTFNHNPPSLFLEVFGKLLMYYFAFTLPWWMFVVLYSLWQPTLSWYLNSTLIALPQILFIGLVIVLLVIMASIFWSVCILPNRLRIVYLPTSPNASASNNNMPTIKQEQSSASYAIVCHLRLGLYTHRRHIEQLSKQLNKLPVDGVIIFGNWLYHPAADLVSNLMHLRVINKPVYAVQGTDDHRYYPENADQFLREDDLDHAFKALAALAIDNVDGLLPVTNTSVCLYHPSVTQSNSFYDIANTTLVTLIDSKLTKDLSMLDNDAKSDSIATQAQIKPEQVNYKHINKSLLNQSQIILVPKDVNIDLSAIINTKDKTIYKLDGFGKRGLPFRFTPPTINIVNIPSRL